MKKMMERIWEKKNSKKGFTLVELIVVLVILAILAAIMIPALSGWITKAREKQVMLDARNVEMAVQAGLYQEYANGTLTAARDNEAVALAASGANVLNVYINGIVSDITFTDGKYSCSNTGDLTFFGCTIDGYNVTYAPEAVKVATVDIPKGWTITPTTPTTP